jgi:hypothetical protein
MPTISGLRGRRDTSGGEPRSASDPHEKAWSRAPLDLWMASGIDSRNCQPVGKLPAD